MDTYLKISSVKPDKNCNCISPFYINDITGINPNTGREYNDEDRNMIKTSLYRISNAKGCQLDVCCDLNDPSKMPDAEFTQNFKNRYPKVMPIYEGRNMVSIKLSTTADVKESGWQDPTSHLICKITKSKISDTDNPQIKIATNLVKDCFTDQCNQAETIAVSNLMQSTKLDMNSYTWVDDARVSQAILDGNIEYVKEYIRKYKKINLPLSNNDYNNRMIHIAAEGTNKKTNEILKMLIALKANLNVTNKLRETPLHFAVRSQNMDNIEALVTQGADSTIANNNGETPMFYAMKTGDIRIVRMLYNSGSSVLGVDKYGNNLIHYCIQYCPVFKEEDETVPNKKSDIIKFLIERGVSTEQKNLAGKTPLEVVSKSINNEVQREKGIKIAEEDDEIKEKFFNIKPIREAFSNGGAVKMDVSGNTAEHNSLLEIQTMIFNNIIRNNPEKYNKYINVSEVPAGAPIEILDTVCVGEGLTGNEDSEECLANGGQLVKIKNKTTKIKLELLPEQETEMDMVKAKELYLPKNQPRIPKGTVPASIASYNDEVMNMGLNPMPTNTKGMTYNIGETSTNVLKKGGIQKPIPSQKMNINVAAPTMPVPKATPETVKVEGFVNMGSAIGSNAHPHIDKFIDVEKYENMAKQNAMKMKEKFSSLPRGEFVIYNDTVTSILCSVILTIIVVLAIYYGYKLL